MILSCEVCKGEGILREKMKVGLATVGIDPNIFMTLDPVRRFDLLIHGFGLNNDETDRRVRVEDEDDVGLIVIKPEMMRARQRIYAFLSEILGVDILGKRDFIYSPKDYWQIQGGTLRQYLNEIPHAALIFLLSITEPSEVILFKHLRPEEYRNRFRALNSGLGLDESIVSSEDPQRVFTELFVRHSGGVSLRHGVCLEEITRRGFLTMEEGICPGKCWDFTSFFRGRSQSQNSKTFNGIHSPRDTNELRDNLSILGNLCLNLSDE